MLKGLPMTVMNVMVMAWLTAEASFCSEERKGHSLFIPVYTEDLSRSRKGFFHFRRIFREKRICPLRHGIRSHIRPGRI